MHIHLYLYLYVYIYYTYIPVSLSVFSSFIWRQLALSWSWVGLQRFGKTWLCEGLKSCLGNKWGGGQPLLLYLGISRQPATKNQGSSEAGVQKEGNIKNSSLYTPSSLFVTWCHVKTAFSTTNKTALLTTHNACTKKRCLHKKKTIYFASGGSTCSPQLASSCQLELCGVRPVGRWHPN